MDEALEKAIELAGGISALARKLGISTTAISNWKLVKGVKRVPAHRVLQVEEITGIPRSVLRPDIYPPSRKAKRA